MKPHKACDAVIDKIKFPVIVMPKFDGVRACYLNGEFTSRTLKKFRNTRLIDVYGIEAMDRLDGELVVGLPNDPSACRKTTSFCNSHSHNTTGIDVPTWWIFDFVHEGIDYRNRLDNVRNRLASISEQYPGINIRKMPHHMVYTMDELLGLHDTFMQEGYEGTIVRDPNGMHKNGRCTVNEGAFLRIKDIADEEAVVVSLIEAEENMNEETTNELGYKTRSSHKENKAGNGMIGSMMAVIPDGRTIKISAGHMSHEDRIFYFQNPYEIIGRTCTYKYMPYGEKDMRRHPRFKHFRDGDI